MSNSTRFSQPGSDPRDPSQRTQFDPQNDAMQGQQNASEDHGSLEPDDSRNVTGASGTAGVGAPGGSDQQTGGERWGGGQQGQTQTPNAAGQPQGEEVEFDADPTIERQGEVEFEPSGQQSQAMGGMSQSGGGQSMPQMEPSYGEMASGENAASDQMSQFEGATGGQMGGGSDAGSRFASQIREHMEVIGADGVHLGTVDKVEGDRIKLTKRDSGMGGHEGHHHFIGCGLVAGVEGDKVRLSATAATAYGMEEEA